MSIQERLRGCIGEDLDAAGREAADRIDADEALMRDVLGMLEAGDLLCELTAATALRKRLEKV